MKASALLFVRLFLITLPPATEALLESVPLGGSQMNECFIPLSSCRRLHENISDGNLSAFLGLNFLYTLGTIILGFCWSRYTIFFRIKSHLTYLFRVECHTI